MAAPDPQLADLLEEYESQLERTQVADWPAVLRAAIAAAPGSDSRAPLLLLGIPIRSSSEAGFVAAIGSRAPSILATVPRGDERTGNQLRGTLQLVDDYVASAPGQCALEELRAHLFEDHGPGEARQEDTVTILSAPAENRECVEIALCILRFAGQGTPFHQMAIQLRSPDEYRPHLEQALARA